MKTRHSLVSNSSSTSFIVDGNIRDEELRKRLWSVINDIATYIEPDDIEIPTQMYISTGMSQGNECLFKWWQLKKWFVDNKIKHQDSGDGCPELQQRSCDFICYITERDNEQKTDPLRVSELKEWLYNNIANERITKAAESIGITKDEIIDGFKSDQFGEIIRDIMGEPECPQK